MLRKSFIICNWSVLECICVILCPFFCSAYFYSLIEQPDKSSCLFKSPILKCSVYSDWSIKNTIHLAKINRPTQNTSDNLQLNQMRKYVTNRYRVSVHFCDWHHKPKPKAKSFCCCVIMYSLLLC